MLELALSVPVVAKRLGITSEQVRRLIHAGRLRARNMGISDRNPRYRISEDDLERYLRESEAKPSPVIPRRQREPAEEPMAIAQALVERHARGGKRSSAGT